MLTVNALMLLSSCTRLDEPAVEPAQAEIQSRPLLRANGTLSSAGPWHTLVIPAPPGASEAVPPPAPPQEAASTLVSGLLTDLTGATFDRGYGLALDEAIAALPEDRQALGIGGVGTTLLLGNDNLDPLCEDPHALLTLEHEGESYDVSLALPQMIWMVSDPAPEYVPLSEACIAALADSGGDLDALSTDCTREDIATHFPKGSECRACLSEDGDVGRCIEDAECTELAERRVFANAVEYTVLRAPALMCAPDHIADFLFLVRNRQPGDPPPEMFDHGALSYMCFESWSTSDNDQTLICTSSSTLGIGDVLPGRIDFIQPAGGGEDAWAGRVALISSIEIEGLTFQRAALSPTGSQAISAPEGSVPDAWGLNPTELAPDGTDPDNIEHTRARDYLAGYALKTASTRPGISVQPFTLNRCAEEDWIDLDDGRSWCEQPGAWSASGWDDAFITRWSSSEWYAVPLVTLASTGLPDDSIPGALAPRVLGSTTLADPEWEGCTWPETFAPDVLRMYDPTPYGSSEAYATFDGETYRFSRDDGLDIVMALATSQRRYFCPAGL